MTLVFDRSSKLGDGPGTHALLCGVDHYPHLPGGGGELTPFHFEMRQLSTAVRTVRAVHDWLVDRADQLAAPLATTRMLLAPGADDSDVARDVEIERPTLESFLREAAAWRDDASAHHDGVAMFYIAGHGFILSRADQLVLLEDYGAGIGSILYNTINVGSIVQGMAPTERTRDIARTQLYFVDSGQMFETLPSELSSSSPTQVFNLPSAPGTDRVAITFSPAPGGVAYGRVGGMSILGSALLDCFDGLAAERVDGGWGITTLGLVRALPKAVRSQLAEWESVKQEVTAGGLIGPAVIVRLPGPPNARLAIAVAEKARRSAVVTVRDSSFTPVFDRGPGVDALLELALPAGLYVVELKVPDGESMLETVALSPSETAQVALGSPG